MRAAAESFADVVSVGANIKSFATQHAEIDFGQFDPVDCVAIYMDKAWLALHDFSLTRQLIQRHAAVLLRRNHGRQLAEIAAEFFERSPDLMFIQRGHRTLLNDFAFPVLSVDSHAEQERRDELFILPTQQILN